MENKFKVKVISQNFKSSLIFIIFIIFIKNDCIFGQISDCPNGLVSFELMSGHVFTTSSDKMTVLSGISHLNECMDRCLLNNTCKSLNFETGSCILLTSSATERPEDLKTSHFPVFTIYAQKICLTDKKKACTHGWAFERVKGYELKKMDRKKFKAKSSLECMQLCLNEMDFECRSVNFDIKSGECSLSDMDRHTINVNNDIISKKYGPSSGSAVDYIENNCIQEPTKFCDFRRINDKILKTVDSVYKDVKTISECREKCLNSPYRCHSFDFSDPSNSVCRISHLDKNSLTHIENPYLKVSGATTYELSMCYNVTITCRAREMVAKVKTSKLFNGKIYAKSKPNYCVNDISNSLEFDIKMQYNNDECDVKQSSPGHFTNDIVIQHHDMVVTTRDLALGVFCKFDLFNDSISIVDLTIDGDILTDRLRGSAKLPDLSLHIVDINGADIDSVALGDTLRVQVRMSDEATYGIFVRNLIAKDGFGGTNNLTLIDNTGCPVEAKMMREVRTMSKERKSLESYLEAFTFTGSSTLEIEAEVETCLDKCRPVQCQIITGRSDDDYETVTSYGRRKRRSPVSDVELAEKGDILSLTMLSKIVSIQANKDVSKIESQMNKKSSEPVKSPFRRSKSIVPKDSSAFKVTLDKHGFYCFEPTTLATLSGVTLFVQGFMFTAALIMASRLKDTKTMPIM